MKRRRRLGIFASALLFTGVTLLPYYKPIAASDEQGSSCPDLVLQEPQLTGIDAYKYKLKLMFDERRARAEMRDRTEKELVEKIQGLGADNARCAQKVRDAAMQYDIQEVARASVDALVRFNTSEARDALYALIVKGAPETGFNVNKIAAEALIRLDPEMAADALLKRGQHSGYKTYNRGNNIFDETLAKTGSERVLEYYIKYGTTLDVARFIRWNPGKPFIPRYRDLLMPLLERDILKTSYSSFNYGDQFKCGIYEQYGAAVRETEIEYAFAMRELDRMYAEKVLVPIARNSQGCSPYLVRALQGKY